MRHVVYDVSSAITWVSWACVALVWAVGLREQQPSKSSERGEARDLASLAGLAAGVLAFALPASLWHSFTLSSPWVELVGVLVLVPAAAAAIWSRLELGSSWSSAARVQEQHVLRTDGPYAITRHPIYSAIILMLIGTCLTQGFGRWALLLVAITLLLRSKIAAEERLLAEQFPDQYSRYRERVPQLLPHVLPRQAGSHRHS